MPTVPVLVGAAPTTTSTLRERNAAEKAGYLIDRGDHLEWHRDRKAWLWSLPGHPAPGRTPLAEARLRLSPPGKRVKLTAHRVRGFVLDGPGVADRLAGAAAPPVPGSVRWWLALRMTAIVTAIVVFSVLLVALVVLTDGNLDFGGGGSGGTRGKGPHLYLLDPDGGVIGALSEFNPHRPGHPAALDLLRRRGVTVDLDPAPAPPPSGGQRANHR